MSHNTFGKLFCITTWGESHGKAIGVVIDGCPAGIEISDNEINTALLRRAPGQTSFTTPRQERDAGRILSGVFEGLTTGAPISILIENSDADSSKYTAIKDLMRPGHANFTYLEKYGIFDYRGGGRASARETACRVAAGEVAGKVLERFGIDVFAHLAGVGNISAPVVDDLSAARKQVASSPIFVTDKATETAMIKAIVEAKRTDDSLGGIVQFHAMGLPTGLGEPVYDKIDALLAQALMSIPAAKGMEIGSGFAAAAMKGSEHNDAFTAGNEGISTLTNHAGGCLGGISTGQPLYGRVAFKPTASIFRPMQTVDIHGNPAVFELPKGSRHDPCVAIRAVPVVEAMCRLVLVDMLLLHRARVMRKEKTCSPS